jgi:CRP/FNR family transcriptional regulator, cyclic AMP receptor protein
MPRLDDLTASVLFEGVSPEGVQMALQGTTELSYQPGDVLIRQEAQGEAIYLLQSGVVRVTRSSLGGRVRLLGDLYAPAVLGETAVLGGQHRSATVTAQEPVRAMAMYRDHLERVMNRHPRVLWNLANLLAERVTQLNDELIAAGISTEASMAQVLGQMYSNRVSAGVYQPEVLPLTVTDLSQRLSSSRETAHRLLRRWQQTGIIQIQAHSVRVINPQALERLLFQLAEE